MSQNGRVVLIDALRGLAAVSVVLYHYVGFIPLMEIPVGSVGAAAVAVTRFGHVGVPIFFVLSGYVIAMTASRHAFTGGTAGRFVLRRLVRIAPPYWAIVCLAAAAILVGWSVGLFRNTGLGAGQVGSHFVYAQNVLGYTPLDVAHWTLCLEVQFYVAFAASLVAVRRLPLGAQAGCFLASAVASLVLCRLDAVPVAFFPRLWYQFAAGVLTHYAAACPRSRPAWLAFLIAVAANGVDSGSSSDIATAVAAALLFLDGRYAPNYRCPKTVLLLGAISYSLYLVHGFLGLFLGAVFRTSYVRSEAAAWLAIAACTTAALLLAALFYRVIERRAVGWSRRVRIDRGPPARPE